MKKLILTAAIIASCFAIKQADAQIHVDLNVGSQSEWEPVGYNYDRYYYMPDIDTYYSIPIHQYIYQQGNRWVSARYLPSRYRNYDINHCYRVVINQHDPWLQDDMYQERYYNYQGRGNQLIMRNGEDDEYRNYRDNGDDEGDDD